MMSTPSRASDSSISSRMPFSEPATKPSDPQSIPAFQKQPFGIPSGRVHEVIFDAFVRGMCDQDCTSEVRLYGALTFAVFIQVEVSLQVVQDLNAPIRYKLWKTLLQTKYVDGG